MFGGEPQPNEPQLHQHRTQSSGHAVWAETRTPSRAPEMFCENISCGSNIFCEPHATFSRFGIASGIPSESGEAAAVLAGRDLASPPLTLTYCNTHKERDEEGFYRGQSLCLYNGLNLEQSTQPGAPPDTTRERLVDTWTGGSWVARQPSSIPLCHISSSLPSAVSPRAANEGPHEGS